MCCCFLVCQFFSLVCLFVSLVFVFVFVSLWSILLAIVSLSVNKRFVYFFAVVCTLSVCVVLLDI